MGVRLSRLPGHLLRRGIAVRRRILVLDGKMSQIPLAEQGVND
jgi:hypothetical protein